MRKLNVRCEHTRVEKANDILSLSELSFAKCNDENNY